MKNSNVIIGILAFSSGLAVCSFPSGEKYPLRATQPTVEINVEPEPEPIVDRRAQIWWAICQKESNNNANVRPGDGGKAIGIAQIHPIMVEDVNRILGRNTYTNADRTDPVKAYEIFCIYTNHYTPSWEFELVAKRWNGGPDGEHDDTESYWNDVKGFL